jgi:two-component system sensor histidine kinase CssS
MKNSPLSVQIWSVFAVITLCISILLSIILPLTLRDFFTNEIYATIENSQNLIFNQFDSEIYRDFIESEIFGKKSQKLENARTVNHFLIYDQNQVILSSSLSMEFLNKVKTEIREQKKISQQYSGEVDNEKIFYVITKGRALGKDVFLVSYMGDSYREDLVQTLFKKLALIMTLVFLFSWIPAIGLAKYLSNPLVSLEKRVKKLADHEWNEPVQLDRKDEIGRLGESIELLRNQLIHQDEIQQSFLQHVSHELKTPVMVIRSYAQAIIDGIYPKGNLDCSVQVIDEEAERLEKQIRNLLYLTKLDYLSNHELSRENFYIDDLIKNVVERLSWQKSQLKWSLDLSHVSISGDMEQWRVVLENLLDNQIRYANNHIIVELKQEKDDKAYLRIWNDGPPIEQEIMDTLFNKFNKGYKGEFGLGLAIVQRIITLHGSKIWAKNEDEGVSFYIEIHV